MPEEIPSTANAISETVEMASVAEVEDTASPQTFKTKLDEFFTLLYCFDHFSLIKKFIFKLKGLSFYRAFPDKSHLMIPMLENRCLMVF